VTIAQAKQKSKEAAEVTDGETDGEGDAGGATPVPKPKKHIFA
jgi:hypothetical protein